MIKNRGAAMRVIVCFLLLMGTAGAQAQEPPLTRLAGASFQVADLEKARQFYGGVLGLEEAFDLKDSSGAVRSVFFKANDDQYLEFSPGAPDGFRLEHISLLTSNLRAMAAYLRERGITPGKTAKSPDGNTYFAIQDPNQNEIDFVHNEPGSQESRHRGKAPGGRYLTYHLQHIGIAADDKDALLAFYRDKLGLQEFSITGSLNLHVRVPRSPGDAIELMTVTTQPARGRLHIGFEVPDIQRTYKQLLDRGLSGRTKPYASKIERWILNLHDLNGMRVEFIGEAVAPQNGR
jgi:catechol 2,3-dioxygenase-like lactoylglutathione lyase family enzyme